MAKKLDYQHVALVPRVVSTLKSRSEANTGIDAFGIHLDIPIIASPMPDVCNGILGHELAKLGALGIIHRFQSIENQIEEFKYKKIGIDINGKKFLAYKNIACAIGVTDDYQERLTVLFMAGCRIFCLDTANGANKQVGEAVKWIRRYETAYEKNVQLKNKIYLIAGNVATAEGYKYLADIEVDAVRVGIAGGSVCETKTETGIYMPMVSAVLECVEERNKIASLYASKFCHHKKARKLSNGINGVEIAPNEDWITKFNEKCKSLPLIIADGGIKKPADMCKALALGADFIMCGSILAGTEESPGDVYNIDGRLIKLYRGAASFGVQKQFKGKKPAYVEGKESVVEYKGHVEDIIDRFKDGLQSSMSYMNAKTLLDYRKNATWVEV